MNFVMIELLTTELLTTELLTTELLTTELYWTFDLNINSVVKKFSCRKFRSRKVQLSKVYFSSSDVFSSKFLRQKSSIEYKNAQLAFGARKLKL